MLYIPTTPAVLYCVLLATSTAFVGIVAGWAALGTKPQWFVRCGLLMGLLLLGILVPAYELMAMFFVQSVIALGVLAFYRAFHKRADGTRGEIHFTVRDILFFTFFVAVVLAVICSRPQHMWAYSNQISAALPAEQFDAIKTRYAIEFLLTGTISGVATIMACWTSLPERKLRTSLSMIVLIVSISVLCYYFQWTYGNPGIIGSIPALIIIAWFFLLRGSRFSARNAAESIWSAPQKLVHML